MWQFTRPADEPRFLVLAHPTEHSPQLSGLPSDLRERLILFGALHDLGDGHLAGAALAVQAPTREALNPLLAEYRDAEIHDWEFGGRR